MKRRNEKIVARSVMSPRVGAMPGIVMCRKQASAPAPSIRAASYSSAWSVWKAVRTTRL